MPEPRIGGLFFGYGGLDLAVREVLGGELAWVSEIDRGACRIIEHRFPGVPNLGDITTIDWDEVEPVDVLTGGSPCQDLSTAGRHAGMTEGTRSNLWVAMREAIARLRPGLVVWENVRGAYSALASSGMVPESGPLGDDPTRPVLRALGRVLGDLAGLGYDARWCGLRAADVGAPHPRFRVFVIAHPAETEPPRADGSPGVLLPVLDAPTRAGGSSLLPTVLSIDGKFYPDDAEGRLARGDRIQLAHAINLTGDPADDDPSPAWWDDLDEMSPEQLGALLPAPKTDNNDNRPGDGYSGGLGWVMTTEGIGASSWGRVGPAIERWTKILGRAAPAPVVRSGSGRIELSAEFTEWMMGLPEGWVTAPEIWASYTDRLGRPPSRDYVRRAQIHALGNGVCPPQAAEALRILLGSPVFEREPA